MRKTLLTIVALLVTVTSTGFAQNEAVRMIISLQPAHQLPFLPPSIQVEAVNDGSTPVTIPNFFALEVTRKDGLFVATFHDQRRTVSLGDTQNTRLAIPPHSTTRFVFGATLEFPYFFCDQRLGVPGTYQLRLVADQT